MAEFKNRRAEQLLSDLHQKRLEQALDEFNADKTRMAVGRLLEEYVDDGGKSYFDGAQKDATLYFVDDEYMNKVSDVEPTDEVEPKKHKKGGFFAGAINKLAEKMKTEEPEDYEDEFSDEIEENYGDDSDDEVTLIDGTNKGFDMPDSSELQSALSIEEEEAVPPVKPSIFDTAKLSSMDMEDIENCLEKANLKPATMDFVDPDDVLKEILEEEEPKVQKKPAKKEGRKKNKATDALEDIEVEDMGLGNIVKEIAKEEELKAVAENKEETAKAQEPKVEETEELEQNKDNTDDSENATAQEAVGESTITVTSVPEEAVSEPTEDTEEQYEPTKEDYPTKFKEKNSNKNTYVAEKTVILDKPLIDADSIEATDEVSVDTVDAEDSEAQPLSQEDKDMTKEDVLNAIKTETEAEVEEEVIPSRRRRRIAEEKKKGKKKNVEPVEEEIKEDEEELYDDDFEEDDDKPKKGLFGLFKKKKKKDEEDDFDEEDEIEEDDDIEDDGSHYEDEDEDDFEDEDDYDEDEYYEEDDEYDDNYRKGSSVKKFFVGVLFVILVVAVTALAAMCYSYKSQLDSTREQLKNVTGGGEEETTSLVEDITFEDTTAEITTEEKAVDSANTAVVSSGNNTQAVQILNGDGTASDVTGATASGTTYVIKSGDTGEKICKSLYGEYTPEAWHKILVANNMNESSTYHPGQELIIP